MKAKAKVRRVSKSTRKHKIARTRKLVRTAKKQKSAPKKAPISQERLILDHRENGRKLARSLLRRWRVRMPSEEIDSIVDLTLCEAARRYSDTHGASFMTFLFYHLRGNLVRAIATAAKSNNFVVAFARTAGIDVGDWGSNVEQPVWSVMAEFSAFNAGDAELPDQMLLRQERIDVCKNACDQLEDLEREVLTRSYANEEALVDIARSLGYSRCHISRVKKRALDRLRELMHDFHDGMPAPAADESDAEEHTDLIPEVLPDNVRLFRKRQPLQSAVAIEALPIQEALPKVAAA